MAEVTLVIKADTTSAVKNVNDLQKANQKLYDTTETSSKRRLGRIEQEEKAIANLTRLQKQATTESGIAQYNKLIDQRNEKLKEYNKLGRESEKQTQSMTQSITKWALSLGGATAIVGALWGKMKELTVVINAQNLALAAYNQVLYNITTNQTSWLNGVVQAIKLQDQLNTLRLKEYKDQFLAQEQRTKFQNAWYEALNEELSLKERIAKADEALAAKEEEINIKRENARERLNVVSERIRLQQGTEADVKEFWASLTELKALDAEFAESTKRVFRMKQGFIKQEREEKMQAWFDEIEADNKAYAEKLELQKKYQELSKRLTEEYAKSNIDSLTGGAKLVAQRNFALQQIEDFKNEILAVGKLSAEQEIMIAAWVGNVKKSFAEEFKKETPEKAETKNIFADFVDELLTPDTLMANKPGKKPMTVLQMLGIDPDTDQGKAQLAALKEAKDTIISVIDEIFAAEAEDAQRRREILDNRVQETQDALEAEIRLYEAGYSSNVAGKKKELEQIKKLRDAALKKEEEAVKKKRQLDTITQLSSLITAAAQTFNAFPGMPLVAAALIAVMFAAFAASKVKAAEMTKLAAGGSGSDRGMVTGRTHAQGGERFLSQVEVERGEAWGVLSVPATQKFGKVFHHMVSSFNKGEIPRLSPVTKVDNNVLVENSGPNERLDRLIYEQKKLNEKITSDSMQDIGSMRVIRKGSTTRVIKR